jgi:hypothetical protein
LLQPGGSLHLAVAGAHGQISVKPSAVLALGALSAASPAAGKPVEVISASHPTSRRLFLNRKGKKCTKP